MQGRLLYSEHCSPFVFVSYYHVLAFPFTNLSTLDAVISVSCFAQPACAFEIARYYGCVSAILRLKIALRTIAEKPRQAGLHTLRAEKIPRRSGSDVDDISCGQSQVRP